MQNHTPIDHLIKPNPTSSSQSTERLEHPPSSKPLESAPLHEVVEHVAEHEIPEYIQEHKDVIELSPDIQSLGVESTGVPSFTTTQPVTLPLSDETIVSGLKAPYSSSLRWLSEFCVYLLKRAHMHLKNIHGRIMRVTDTTKRI